ncbi:MAG: aspartate ammonia-lyase [Candidatus Hydrogenedentes bacterium]|nr:aspartate ammonia-lyase [Candidatus Hydrogenedentota bacterium]
MVDYRIEFDLLGEKKIPKDVYWGIHTARAIENFEISHFRIHPELIHAYGLVKLACAKTNCSLGYLSTPEKKAECIITACEEVARGNWDSQIVVDALQGGAGTSTNMNVNEVIANRALELMGYPKGTYNIISPIDDVNLHQSTNDTYPTALRLACIKMLRKLETAVVGLVESFQKLEREMSGIVKVARTEMQDAVLITLGREMGAYADALARDRWRIYKCEERLRVVNLGGTAVGTGIGAPRDYIFRVVDVLRELSGIGVSRAENLVEATQNLDVFSEVSGIIRSLAVTLNKISSDFRLLSSGPEAGLKEILLPPLQAGSSIMPGKVNPVLPEAVSQVAFLTFGLDQTLTLACASGNLELNPFIPLIAFCILTTLESLTNVIELFSGKCVREIRANEKVCHSYVRSSTALLTAVIPKIGYEKACEVAKRAKTTGKDVADVLIEDGLVSLQELELYTSPESVCRLGFIE